LASNSLVAARIAALAAFDAAAASYFMDVGPAMDAGVTVEQIQNILVAVAPVIGAPRTASAAMKISEALGIVITDVRAELEGEEQGQ
jgi:alkylhydroperoxidase/carboxymuconolactone decarboxylase family protein YurZ